MFGTFVPFTTTGGVTLHSGMNEGELGLPFRKRGQGRAAEYLHARELAREGEVAYDRAKAREALSFARARPGAALGLTAAKLAQLWTPLQRKGSSAVYAAAVLLAWWAVLVRRVRLRPALIGPMLLVMTLVGAVFLALPRYRAPYHPYVFTLAAAGLLAARPAAKTG